MNSLIQMSNSNILLKDEYLDVPFKGEIVTSEDQMVGSNTENIFDICL